MHLNYGTIRKSLQKSIYNFASTKWGGVILVILAFITLNTFFHFLESILGYRFMNKMSMISTENEKFLNMYTDNIDVMSRDFKSELSYPPIDIVYTWVNGSDPRHQKNLKKWYDIIHGNNLSEEEEEILEEVFNITKKNPNGTRNEDIISFNRYRDNSELKYSLRSVEKFAPWVRKIFLVTNGQIPHWLNVRHPKLRVIQHSDIYANQSHLPVFSSPSIESHLHQIEGLSDKFIYLNDDVIFGKEIFPEDFYSNTAGQFVFLSWDVPECNPGCASSWIGDGYCDIACNVSACHFDGGDCVGVARSSSYGYSSYSSSSWADDQKKRVQKQCAPRCPNNWIGDKFCDKPCNVLECGFDAGDCGVEEMKKKLKGWMLKPSMLLVNVNLNVTKALYFNLSKVFGKNVVIDDGYHNDSTVIRSSTISQTHKILTITLHKYSEDVDYPVPVLFELEGKIERKNRKDQKIKSQILVMVHNKTGFSKEVVFDENYIEPEPEEEEEEIVELEKESEEDVIDVEEEEEPEGEEGEEIRNVRTSEFNLSKKNRNVQRLLQRLKRLESQHKKKPVEKKKKSKKTQNVSHVIKEMKEMIVENEEKGEHEKEEINELLDILKDFFIKKKKKKLEEDLPPEKEEEEEDLPPSLQDPTDIDGEEEPRDGEEEPLEGEEEPMEGEEVTVGNDGELEEDSEMDDFQNRGLLSFNTELEEDDFFEGDEEYPSFKQIKIVDHPKIKTSFRYLLDEKLRKLEKREEFLDIKDKMDDLRNSFQNSYVSQSLNRERKINPFSRILLDTFGDSLVHVNSLLDDLYGRQSRKVPAHMPHMIDKHIMKEAYEKFEEYFDATSSNKFRSSNDMQYSFTYFYYLMSEGEKYDEVKFFDDIDRDNDGKLGDYEIVHLSSMIKKKKIDLDKLKAFHFNVTNRTLETSEPVELKNETKNETKNASEEPSGNSTSSSSSSFSFNNFNYGNFFSGGSSSSSFSFDKTEYDKTMEIYDYVYDLLYSFVNNSNGSYPNYFSFVHSGLSDFIAPYFNNSRGKYKYELKDLSQVGFFMIRDDEKTVFDNLESLRVSPKKFYCLNDDMNATSPNELVLDELHKWFEWYFPNPSQFELPKGKENPFLYLNEMYKYYQRVLLWKSSYIFITSVLSFCFICCVFIFVILCCPQVTVKKKKSILRAFCPVMFLGRKEDLRDYKMV